MIQTKAVHLYRDLVSILNCSRFLCANIFVEAGAFNTIAVSTPDTPLEFQTPIIVESLPMEWLDQPMTPPASQTSFQSGISGIRLQDSTPPSQGFTPPRGKRSRRERSGTPCSRRVSDIRNTNQSEPPSTTHQPPSFRTTMQNVQGDGNCFFRYLILYQDFCKPFFRAIAFILRGWESDQDHRLLRRLAMDEWLGMDFVGYPVTNILDFDSNIGHHDLQSYTVLQRKLLFYFLTFNSRLLKGVQLVVVGM